MLMLCTLATSGLLVVACTCWIFKPRSCSAYRRLAKRRL